METGTDSSQNNPVMGSWSYSHDTLNRLVSAQKPGIQSPGTIANYCWSYDAFGNRLQQMGSDQAITGGGAANCQEMTTPAFQSGSGGESPSGSTQIYANGEWPTQALFA